MWPYIRSAMSWRAFALFALSCSLIAAIAVLTIRSASAQSVYPGECCGEYDCFNEPIAPNLVERRPDGWFLVKEKRVIPFNHARPSPDQRFHICRNEMGKGSIIIPHGRPACLWVPEAEN